MQYILPQNLRKQFEIGQTNTTWFLLLSCALYCPVLIYYRAEPEQSFGSALLGLGRTLVIFKQILQFIFKKFDMLHLQALYISVKLGVTFL